MQRASVTGTLDVEWDDRLPPGPAIDDEQRLPILRRLLHDYHLDLRDRFTGSVPLLYGQPITRIAALRTTDIHITLGGKITLRLGRGQIPLPGPLAAIAQPLRDQQLTRTGTDGWLLPGRHAGQHITAGTLQHRLKRSEIERSREGRHAALLGSPLGSPPRSSPSGSVSTSRARRHGSGWPGRHTPTTSLSA